MKEASHNTLLGAQQRIKEASLDATLSLRAEHNNEPSMQGFTALPPLRAEHKFKPRNKEEQKFCSPLLKSNFGLLMEKFKEN